MAIQFDEIDDYYSIADDASLTLPNSDWCVGIWTRVDDNTGTLFQYLTSNNNFSAANSLNIYITEASNATNPGEWYITTDLASINSTSTPNGDGKDRLIIAQRSGSSLELWFCEPGQSATSEATGSLTTAIDGGVWNIGRRVDGNVDRYYGGIAGEFFKGDFALTSDEITALGSGLTILDLGKTPDVYQPFETAESTNKDIFGSNDATRNSAPTTVEHFPVTLPGVTYVNFSVAVGGTIYTVDHTDGLFFTDSDVKERELLIVDSMELLDSDTKGEEKNISDTLFLSDQEFIQSITQLIITDNILLSDSKINELDLLLIDSILISDELIKALELLSLDSLFINDSVSTEIISGGVLSITVVDSLLLLDDQIKERSHLVTDSLLLGDSQFNEFVRDLIDNLLVKDLDTKEISLTSMDRLLLGDSANRIMELLHLEGLLIRDSSLTQKISASIAVLVYAKLKSVDYLGITARAVGNYLGITEGAIDNNA